MEKKRKSAKRLADIRYHFLTVGLSAGLLLGSLSQASIVWAADTNLFNNIRPAMTKAQDVLPIDTTTAQKGSLVYSDTGLTISFATVLAGQSVSILARDTDYIKIKVGPYEGYVDPSVVASSDSSSSDGPSSPATEEKSTPSDSTSADKTSDGTDAALSADTSDAADTVSAAGPTDTSDLVAVTLSDDMTVYVAKDDLDAFTSAEEEKSSALQKVSQSDDYASKLSQIKGVVSDLQKVTSDLQTAEKTYTDAKAAGDENAEANWGTALQTATDAYNAAADKINNIK